MAYFDQTIIVGNVGADPEMRYLENGTAVASFNVAVTKRWTDNGTQEKREKTQWVRVTCWRKLAETANSIVRKGASIMVTGESGVSAYINDAGEAVAKRELTADNFQLLGGRRDAADGDEAPVASNTDDIPF